jgi:hypothetical protein
MCEGEDDPGEWADGPGLFVKFLLQEGRIKEGTAAFGIAKQVADPKAAPLSEAQQQTLEQQVLTPHAIHHCKIDGENIPWDEMSDAVARDGICSSCWHQMNKDE